MLSARPNTFSISSDPRPYFSLALYKPTNNSAAPIAHQQSAPTQALPALNAQQQHKLRLLTLLTLSHIPSALNYATLATSLGLRSTSELEPLLIQAISSGLLSGRLNPASSRLDVRSVAPLRDLAPGSLVALAGVLGAWEQRCAQVLAEVEMQIESTRRKAQARGRAEAEWDKMIDERVGVPRLGKQTRAAGGTDDDLAKGGKRDRGDDGSGSDAKRGGKFAAGGRRSSAVRP